MTKQVCCLCRLLACGAMSFVLLSAGACSDLEMPTAAVLSPQHSSPMQGAAIDSMITSWNTASDSALWEQIASRDTLLTIGLKSPKAVRGLIDGKPTASREEWAAAIEYFSRPNADFRIAYADSAHLPIIRVRPHNLSALKAIRRLPFVAFAEPARMSFESFDICGDGNSPYGSALMSVPFPSASLSDRVSATYEAMHVPNAWKLSSGVGVTVGQVDTGLDGTPQLEFDLQWFSGRTLVRGVATNEGAWVTTIQPTCSHGTRVAGLAVAPRNGYNVMGISYNSGLVSVQHDSDVDGTGPNSGHAVHFAAVRGAKVIIMAFGSLYTESHALSWEIEDHYYNDDVVFVGAAGSGVQRDVPAYPASKGEVIAVTGAEHNGARPAVFDFGTKYPGVVAYTNLATTALASSTIVNIGGSSGATGAVGGIVALMRARNPSFDRNDIAARLVATASMKCGAPAGIWRSQFVVASAAVGGPCVSHLTGPSQVYAGGSLAGNEFFAQVTRTFANGHAAGGSGNYSVVWAPLSGGAEADGAPWSSSGTDVTGDYVSRFNQDYRFLHAPDGLPYLVRMSVRVTDNSLALVEQRQLDVTVCSSSASCWSTTRLYPTPPPPAGLSVSILGPDNIPQNGSYSWTASVSGASGRFSVAWTVSSDDGQTWTSAGSGSTYNRSFSDEAHTFYLRATVTDSSGSSQATKVVFVNTYCGGPEIC